MDAQRAQEIANSPNMANVTYNGSRVYVEHVEQESLTATIHPIGDRNKKLSVHTTNLQEH